MANPSEHKASAPRSKEQSRFGCFILAVMLLVLVGSVVQVLASRPDFKVAAFVLLLVAVSVLLMFQVIRGGDRPQHLPLLKQDYVDRVMMEYLGMDEAYLDESLDQRLKRSGERGEQQVAHALSWLPEEQFAVFHQVYISARGKGQQFDHLVVGPNGVFHIETKNHSGRINITPEGNWEITRTIGGRARTEGIESPLEQVRRHELVLKYFLDDLFGKHRIPIQEIVVIANPKSTIKGEQYSPFVILKRERILDFIMDFGKPGSITPDNRRRIVHELEKRAAH